MVTIQDLQAREKGRVAEKERAAALINEITAQIEAIKQRRQDAANDGDLSSYQSANNELTAAEDRLTVTKAHLKNLQEKSLATSSEAALAWQSYSAQYDKHFEQKQAAFEKKREEMLASYRELIDLQSAALATRERLYNYAGMSSEGYSFTDRPYDMAFPCRLLPDKTENPRMTLAGTTIKDPDALYYLICASKNLTTLEFTTNQDMRRIVDVIGRHTTKPYI